MKIFDAHCDTLDLLDEKSSLFDCECHYNIKKASKYQTHIQMMNIWADNQTHTFPERIDTLTERFYKETQGVSVIKSKNDLENADGVCMLLGIEGGEGLQGSLERLDELFDMGLRLVTLTWNHANEIGGTAFENGGGLTPFGKQAVRQMEKLGIMADVSHLSEAGFYDVCRIAEKPFIASHSNAKPVCDIFRNLTDEQFKCLIKSGGVAGINLCVDFLGESPNIDTVFSHIEHFMALGGENNVGIGADFDGIPTLPRGFENGAADLYKIAERLLKANYSQALTDGIMFGNMRRAFMEVLPR